LAVKKKSARKKQRTRVRQAAPRKKKVQKDLRPQAWYINLGRERAAERARMRIRQGMLSAGDVRDYINKASYERRANVTAYLIDTVKELRRYFKGFEGKDGYDLRYIPTWSQARYAAVERYGAYLHMLKATPHVDVPLKRYKGKRRAEYQKQLRRASGQGSKRQKKIIYHVETEKREVKVRLSKRGKLQEIEKLPTRERTAEYWYFRDFTRSGRAPVTFEGIMSAARRMVDVMPAKWFVLIDVSHGRIDTPTHRDGILEQLARYGLEYKTKDGFAAELLGYVRVGSRKSAFSDYNKRLARRSKRESEKQKKLKAKRARIRFLKAVGRVK
jgi:hypothetical protein